MKEATSRPNGRKGQAQWPRKQVVKERNVRHMSHMIYEILDQLSKIGYRQVADRLYDKLEQPDDETLPGIPVDELPTPAWELVVAACQLHLARQWIAAGRADDAIELVSHGVSMAVVHGAYVLHEDPIGEIQRERARKTGTAKRAVKDWYLKKAKASFRRDDGMKRAAAQRPTKRQVSERAYRTMSSHRMLWKRGTKDDTQAAQDFSRLSAPGYKDLLLGAWGKGIPTKESLYSYYIRSLKERSEKRRMESLIKSLNNE